ncbi:MAG: KEOPS complex subunit Pcc1 [Nitrososphaerota archaeon]|nr:KEOPS complex subunit Pcc1 [Candidatus Bathyarchaeota archaeon]MDW8023602.1 KEOPS complex subunit Pcc1 [Nitrososphaerota archaeon]
MRAKAILRIRASSKRISEIVCQSLLVEVKRPATTRSKADLKIKGNLMVLTVDAKDTVALRAALNAYLRWISSCIKLLHTIEKIV